MVQICQSTVIDAPIEAVWRVLRDFNGHDRWHPAIATSAIEADQPVDMIGAVRRFRLTDGEELREQLLSLSDEDWSFTYCILEAPLPLMGYVATVRLKPVTDGGMTFWEWRSEFRPPEHRREELTALVRDNIYRAGFEAIRKMFGAARPVVSREPAPQPRGRVAASSAPDQPAVRTLEPVRAATGETVAIVVDQYGGPEVLRPRQVGLRTPGPGEVLIRHTAVGVNFIDVYCRTGYFDLLTPPGVPGMEAAGVIEAIGAGVARFAAGDRVAYACPPVGAYCARRVMAQDLLVHLPDDISDEQAAAGLLKGVSASFLLHDVHPVRPGQFVLVHAAAGGVGQLLVQWAHQIGAHVIATVSGDDKARLVRGLGAEHVIVYSRENFPERVLDFTSGRGADVIYDAVGADTFAGSLEALATRGHLVSFGQASGPVGSWDIGRFAAKSVTLSRPNYGHFTDTREKLMPHVERFFGALRHRIVELAPPTRYALADAATAHRDLEARNTTGSLILVP